MTDTFSLTVGLICTNKPTGTAHSSGTKQSLAQCDGCTREPLVVA